MHNGTVAQGQGELQGGPHTTAAASKSYSVLNSSSIGSNEVRKQPPSETNTFACLLGVLATFRVQVISKVF